MKTILYLCFLSSVALTFGQNSIQGMITDAETGNSLSYVNIYIPHLEKGTSTDESGYFLPAVGCVPLELAVNRLDGNQFPPARIG